MNLGFTWFGASATVLNTRRLLFMQSAVKDLISPAPTMGPAPLHMPTHRRRLGLLRIKSQQGEAEYQYHPVIMPGNQRGSRRAFLTGTKNLVLAQGPWTANWRILRKKLLL